MFAAVAVPELTGIIFIVLAIIVLLIILSFIPVGLWISALAASVKISIFDLIGMRLRRKNEGRNLASDGLAESPDIFRCRFRIRLTGGSKIERRPPAGADAAEPGGKRLQKTRLRKRRDGKKLNAVFRLM